MDDPVIMWQELAMTKCPHIASLPAVIEHQKTCPVCRAMTAPDWSLRWWALEIVQAVGVEYDEEIERYLDSPSLGPVTESDPVKRQKMNVAHLANYLATKMNAAKGQVPPPQALPDVLMPSLRVIFCGTAAGNRSASVGAY